MKMGMDMKAKSKEKGMDQVRLDILFAQKLDVF